MDTRVVNRLAFPLTVALLLVAFIFGGGGQAFGLANLVVQLAALGVLAVCYDEMLRFWREAPLTLRGLIAASLMLPILQLIPLPETVWTTLPGRETVSRSLELTGGGGWLPLSVDPLRTLLALTALITPLAALLAGWKLPRERLADLGWVVVGMGIVTMLLGTMQLSNPSQDVTLYGAREPGKFVLGTFANRNSTGLFLTFAIGLAALLPAPRPHPIVLPARVAICVLLTIVVALTQSRTALVLALLPLSLGGMRGLSAMLKVWGGASASRALMIGLGALALAGIGGAAVLVASSDRVEATLERFEAKDDARRYIWDDAIYSAGKYWPAGAGMGVFDEVFQVDESLENLTMRRAGRAHNDYIELTIEAGASGLIIAGLWLALVIWLSWQARRSAWRWAGWSASAFLIAIALQSITDYPLRNQTILAMAGYALLLLTRIATDHPRREP